MGESVLFSVFLIFTGAALLATVALFARQSLLIAYIAVGVIAGPSVTGLIADPHLYHPRRDEQPNHASDSKDSERERVGSQRTDR